MYRLTAVCKCCQIELVLCHNKTGYFLMPAPGVCAVIQNFNQLDDTFKRVMNKTITLTGNLDPKGFDWLVQGVTL